MPGSWGTPALSPSLEAGRLRRLPRSWGGWLSPQTGSPVTWDVKNQDFQVVVLMVILRLGEGGAADSGRKFIEA